MTAQDDAEALPAGTPPSGAAPDRLPNAAERLEQSRERIRAYFDSHRPRARRTVADAGDTPPWLEKLRANPLFDGVADAVGSWWRSHPLHSVFVVGETALRESLSPLARRHPIALAAAAVALGALLYRTRLLRRLLKPAFFAGLATQVATRMIERVPLEAVLDAFSRFREAGTDGTSPPPATAPDLPGAAPDAVIQPPASTARH